MTETMWKVLDILRQLYLNPLVGGGYRAMWHLEDEIGVKLAGCGVPDGDPALQKLVEMGLIEELFDLGCRFRIRIYTNEALR